MLAARSSFRLQASPAGGAVTSGSSRARRLCIAVRARHQLQPEREAAGRRASSRGVAVASGAWPYDAAWLWRQSLVMGGASAVLGPLCDGQHSSGDVLHYVASLHLSLPGGLLQLETCWWVPLMFALAGVILGVSHPLLDSWQLGRGGPQPRGGTDPSWAFVLVAVALFVLQYASSGALEAPLLGVTLPGGMPALDAFLLATAAALWAAFDGTPQGLFMAALTTAAGPAVEITLINALHLYSYTHPAVCGVPTWIPWVYAAGAPAVGNLGRKVSSALLRRPAR